MSIFGGKGFLPKKKKKIEFSAFYQDSEAELIMQELMPKSMDDKWSSKNPKAGWVTLHRSWTGHCIYVFKLDGSPGGGSRVTECWVNADNAQYNVPHDFDHVTMLENIIRTYLLKNE
jgi:hypothetical protein